MTERYARIRAFIVAQVSQLAAQKGVAFDPAAEDVDLIGSGIMDSLAFLNLLASVEGELGIQASFENLDPEQFTRLAGLMAALAAAGVAP